MSDKLKHACAKTCSGWEDGYTKGMAFMKQELSWQPIETAPKDEVFVGYFPDGANFTGCPYYQITCWDDDYWIGSEGSNPIAHQPTHWMPIPESPHESNDETDSTKTVEVEIQTGAVGIDDFGEKVETLGPKIKRTMKID